MLETGAPWETAGRFYSESYMFADVRAYEKFAEDVRRKDRFGLSKDVQAFINEFRKQLPAREFSLSAGSVFYRAANDYEDRTDEETGQPNYLACSDDRMLPNENYAYEGRINPQGIVVLYMATSSKTAVSEIRPWVGDWVSVVQIETVSAMRLVDFSKLHGEHQKLMWREIQSRIGSEPLSDLELDEVVWSKIDNAFSRPVSRGNTNADYTPTQMLASIVQAEGFDGIAYKSVFGGEMGYNVALFKVHDIKLVWGNIFEVKEIEVSAVEAGNAWSRAK